MTNEDIVVCYDMSLKEFEHSAVHDLFKECFYVFAIILSFIIFHITRLIIFFNQLYI